MTVANATQFLPLGGGQTEPHTALIMLIQHMALVLGSVAARASVQSDLRGPQHEAMEDSRCCRPPPIPSLTTHTHTHTPALLVPKAYTYTLLSCDPGQATENKTLAIQGIAQ